MNDRDQEKKSEAFPNVSRTHEQDVADEHVFDFLVAFRRAAEEENGRRGGHDVADADDGLLWNLAGAFAGHGKNRGAKEGKAERNDKGRPAFQVQVEQDRDTNA